MDSHSPPLTNTFTDNSNWSPDFASPEWQRWSIYRHCWFSWHLRDPVIESGQSRTVKTLLEKGQYTPVGLFKCTQDAPLYPNLSFLMVQRPRTNINSMYFISQWEIYSLLHCDISIKIFFSKTCFISVFIFFSKILILCIFFACPTMNSNFYIFETKRNPLRNGASIHNHKRRPSGGRSYSWGGCYHIGTSLRQLPLMVLWE